MVLSTESESRQVQVVAEDRLLRLAEVRHLTGLSRAHVYGLAKEGKFPKPVKLTPYGKASGWLLSEVRAFIAERVAESRQQGRIH